MAQVRLAVGMLEKAIPILGVSSEVGKDVMSALTKLAKHVPPGATSAGLENSALQKAMMERRQEAPMLALMRAQGQGGGAAPAAPAPPAAPAAMAA